jgi:hypothetical protein
MEEWNDSLAQDYGAEHERYLKEAVPALHRKLSASADLESHLRSVGNQASEMHQSMMAQAMKQTLDLPYMDRVTALQGHRQAAQELVRHDLIHQPVPD